MRYDCLMPETTALAYARFMSRLNRYLSHDIGGGPRPFRMAVWINVQKAGTAPFVFLLMSLYDDWSPDAWVYLALHGTYGVCWLLKDMVFPDPNWDARITILGGINSWLFVLGLYWVAPILLITDVLGPSRETSLGLLAVAIALHTLGVVMMMGADTQKYFVLRERKGLIEDGWFARIRHPNYLGEMMLYGSYALIVGHWLPWAILAWVWIGYFLPNMLMKEASMSRYPRWDAYCARAGFLWPKLGRRPEPVPETSTVQG